MSSGFISYFIIFLGEEEEQSSDRSLNMTQHLPPEPGLFPSTSPTLLQGPRGEARAGV